MRWLSCHMLCLAWGRGKGEVANCVAPAATSCLQQILLSCSMLLSDYHAFSSHDIICICVCMMIDVDDFSAVRVRRRSVAGRTNTTSERAHQSRHSAHLSDQLLHLLHDEYAVPYDVPRHVHCLQTHRRRCSSCRTR